MENNENISTREYIDYLIKNKEKINSSKKILFKLAYLVLILDIIFSIYIINLLASLLGKQIFIFIFPFYFFLIIKSKNIKGIIGNLIVHLIIFGTIFFNYLYSYIFLKNSYHKYQFFASLSAFIIIVLINIYLIYFNKKNKITLKDINSAKNGYQKVGKFGKDMFKTTNRNI